MFGIDPDEPQMKRYHDLLPKGLVTIMAREYGSLTKVTNGLALTTQDRFDVLGSVGDDHRFRTQGWDNEISLANYITSGVYYPDDKFQGANLATAFFVDSEIVRSLGWLALPVCDHMYIDNAIMDIGRGLGELHYLKDVVVEHLHPAAGKGIMDASYARTNSNNQMEKDRRAYENWKRTQLVVDIERIKRYYERP